MTKMFIDIKRMDVHVFPLLAWPIIGPLHIYQLWYYYCWTGVYLFTKKIIT